LLTGLYPHQAGIGDMVQNRGVPSYQGYLRDDCVTLGEMLRAAGYRTALAGKWHVGGMVGRGLRSRGDFRFGDPRHPLPTDRGFDRFYGNPAGGGSYFNVWPLVDQDRVIEVPEGFYGTDNYTSAAIGFVEESVRAQQPFFVHLCYNAPHWPLHALPEDIERHRGKYLAGWDAIRTARHERLKGMGLLDKRWPISPRDTEAAAWCDEGLKDWQDARMAVYAAQVDRMDRNIGRMVRRLEELSVLNNTLVIFVSDNGGSAEFLKENGRAESELPFTLDGRPVRMGNIQGLAPGGPDTFMSYGLPWANASNSPFRRFKSWVHEGGISTPFVAHWPDAIKPGGTDHTVTHFVDVAATIVDVAGARYPAEFRGNAITPLEGESFLSLLRGRTWRRSAPLFWEHEGNAAMRRENWKLVRMHPGTWELYDMTRDRTELDSMADRHPGIVKEMASAYGEWAQRCGVMDWEQVKRLPRV
jgi:arylsulfatase